jgi:uncharacterized protein YndB with AHSA1/START domain
METSTKKTITVETTINAPVEKVWEFWTKPEHIVNWNNASDDWHTPKVENDLRVGSGFLSRMEAKDGSAAFDFVGKYEAVQNHEYIEYTITDGRRVQINFTAEQDKTKIVETFEAESTHSIELQQSGWQAILDNFKKYVENNG